MKSKLIILAIIATASLVAAGAMAQTDPGTGLGNGNGVCGFVDENGDGFNDLAPDADGDGIPNGMDPDYVKPADGTGNQFGQQSDHLNGYGRYAMLMKKFAGDALMGKGMGQGGQSGQHFGLGDGSGLGVGPGDGTGFGPGDGTGDCTDDGTPLGSRGGRRGGTH